MSDRLALGVLDGILQVFRALLVTLERLVESTTWGRKPWKTFRAEVALVAERRRVSLLETHAIHDDPRSVSARAKAFADELAMALRIPFERVGT